MTTLRIDQLCCMAGYRPLFKGVCASLDTGQWLCLTGPNGTGKTTLLRALAGLVQPADGTINWQGSPVKTTGIQWRGLLHYLGHSNGLKDNLTAAENLKLQLALDGHAPIDSSNLNDLLTSVGLQKRREVPVGQLSAGQKRRVQLARLAHSQRPLWLLDEPGNALDADGETLLGQLLDRHLQRGGLAVVSTHQSMPVVQTAVSLNLAGQARQ